MLLSPVWQTVRARFVGFLVHKGLDRTWGGDRIGMAMDDPPLVILAAEDGRDPERHRRLRPVLQLHPVPLDLDGVRQVRRRIVRDPLNANDRTGVGVELSGGTVQGSFDLAPAPRGRTQGVGEGHVVASRPLGFLGLGIARHERRHSAMILLDDVSEIGRHHTPGPLWRSTAYARWVPDHEVTRVTERW